MRSKVGQNHATVLTCKCPELPKREVEAFWWGSSIKERNIMAVCQYTMFFIVGRKHCIAGQRSQIGMLYIYGDVEFICISS